MIKLKRRTKLGIVIFLIFLNLSFFVIGYVSYLYPKLGDFQIENVVETNKFLTVNVSPSTNATKYEVTVKKEDEVIYQKSDETNQIVLENLEAEHNDELQFQVKAFNKNDEVKESANTYNYVYQDASFKKDQMYFYTNGESISLTLDGYNQNEDYTVYIYYGKKIVYQQEHVTSSIMIPYESLEGYSGKLNAVLYNKNKRKISTFTFYLNTPVVGKVHILSPEESFSTRWNDVSIHFQGGENANHFYLNLYTNAGLANKVEVFPEDHVIVLPADYLLENTDYTIELEAVYEDFSEISEKDVFSLHVSEIETTSPVYVSHNPSFIKKNTEVSLNTSTSEATIYYTTDGSEPTVQSLVYKEPIQIQSDMTIKTYAVSKNRYDSAINTYEFHIGEKTPVIYLSPSNQFGNYGVQSAGYTTEEDMMNRLADVIERHLKEAGFIVYRNNPYGDINAWNAFSNSVGADFHLAIHSNASSTHTARGIEIHVDKETSPSLSIASNVYNNLWSIYPGNTEPTYNRGVKYARGELGEANDEYVRNGALIEVAFHDQYDDALWIAENLEEIGQNIASSIISYYN